jgi:hypothetical protein
MVGRSDWVEIFKAGKQTASDGRTIVFSPENLDEIVSSYSPEHFRAPLIISHETFGRSDRELAESELAFGIVKKLRREGNSLYAFCDPVAPEVRDWIAQGRIVDRSASFYPPNSANNPFPGKWALRHVALLGKTAPSVKGMEAINLNELNFSEDDDFLEFSAYKNNAFVELFSGLRDFLIESHGLEKAEALIPSYVLRTLGGPDDETEFLQKRMSDLEKKLEDVRQSVFSLGDSFHSTMPKMSMAYQEDDDDQEDEMTSEMQSEIAALREELKKQKRERRRDRIASFMERNRDRLIPRMLEDFDVEFGEDTISENFSSFCEGLSDSQLSYFEQFVSQIPVQVEFNELTAAPVSRRGNKSFSGNGSPQSKILAAIESYQSEHPELSFEQIKNLPEFSEQVSQIYMGVI